MLWSYMYKILNLKKPIKSNKQIQQNWTIWNQYAKIDAFLEISNE